MNIIAVDPGATGAVAVLSPDCFAVWDLGDPGKTAWAIDQARLLACRDSPHARAYVEQVHAMPKQGVSSTFKIGASFGLAVGALLALGVSVEYVTPSKWKRDMGLSRDKDASLELARRLFPLAELHLKKHHNRAEALLLAEWARRREAR